MALRELLRNKFAFLIVFIFSFGCSQPKDDKNMPIFEKVAISSIPCDTIIQNDSTLKLQNGIFYRNHKPFSGITKEVYETDTLKTVRSYFNGIQHGIAKTFFPGYNSRTA